MLLITAREQGRAEAYLKMNVKPLLSVIVANYNNEPYIRECLDSILNQTYKDLEIIVLDDDSTDGSPEIIRKYVANYPGIIKGIFGDVNRGVARTRHEAILQAKGEYITTLDSDDYYSNSQKLEKEMALLMHYKEQDKDIIAFSNIVFVRENRALEFVQGNSTNIKEGRIFYDIIIRSCMIPRDFVLKRDVYFEVGGYDFSLITHEDWDLKIRLAKKYEFYYTGISGTAYRKNPKGLSSTSYVLRTNNLWKVFSKNIKSVGSDHRLPLINRFFTFMCDRDEKYKKGFKKKSIGLYLNVSGSYLTRLRYKYLLKPFIFRKRNVNHAEL
jgi:glycosyltransferase involved in cell wall biosynthesis